MSELQLSLLLLGVLGIVGVMLFNRWQEKKYRKQAEKMFSGGRQDVLFDEPASKAADAPVKNTMVERIEPSFDQSVVVADTGETVKDEAAGDSHAPVQVEQAAAAQEPPPTAAAPIAAKPDEPMPAASIDETIDLIGLIRVEQQPVSADAAKGMMARTQTFSKPVRWQGLEAGRWTEIAPGGQYGELRQALQLADRRGPVTSGDISRFIALAKQFAAELGGTGETEAEDSAAERATNLDSFCADVDVEIGVNLVTGGDHTMPATKVRALAEAAGMKLSSDGVFSFNDDHGVALFTLRNSEPQPFVPDHVKNITTHGITLLLDVPRVAHGVQAFDQMLQLARHIAHSLGGEVVDDNRKPLTDAGAESIRRQLGLIYRQMSGYGIPAGSALALRLFS